MTAASLVVGPGAWSEAVHGAEEAALGRSCMTVLVPLGIGSLRRPVSRGVPAGRGARGAKGSRGGGTEASSAVAGSGAVATDGEDSAGVVGGLHGHTRSGGSGAAKMLCLRATAIGKVVSSKETLGVTRMCQEVHHNIGLRHVDVSRKHAQPPVIKPFAEGFGEHLQPHTRGWAMR